SGVLRPAVEQDERTWDWTMNINARSLLFGARAVAPFMQAQGWGRIIGITSIGSTRVLPEYAMVGISKAAIEAAVRYLAVELAPTGIVCNAISPGVVETEALDFFPSRDQILAEGLRRTPAGRFVQPEEVARLVAFLCSDDARMIMGQVITIDGGYALLA
ncbi:MAG: SDR family oxidoreductase, partial [Anaerolineae bacterium]